MNKKAFWFLFAMITTQLLFSQDIKIGSSLKGLSSLITHETTTVKISEPISLFIVYSTDEDTINLTYNFRIREPNGSLSEIRFDGAKISDTVIKKKVLYPANAMPTIVFDEKEELGTYYFIVQVFNNNIYIRTFILEFNLLE